MKGLDYYLPWIFVHIQDQHSFQVQLTEVMSIKITQCLQNTEQKDEITQFIATKNNSTTIKCLEDRSTV